MRPELLQAMELLASKDPSHVNEAIRLLQGTVYSFSMKVCGHREDAEDTMQEVLLKSIPHLAAIEEPRALAVWLYTVTRNQCWMSRRKSKFAPEQTVTLDELIPDSQELSRLLADNGPTPESVAIGRQEDHLLQKAVLQVPSKYRLILVLHDMEDLDTAEIAKITGLKEGTIRVRLHRARLLVRRALAGGGKPDAGAKKARRKSSPRQTADCRKMFASLSEYLDHRVDDLTCDEMQKHISGCAPCVAFIRDLERVVERCRQLNVDCAPGTSATVRKLLVQEYLRLIERKPS